MTEFDPTTRIWITEFQSRFDNEPRGRNYTWTELVERLKRRDVRENKEAGPLFSPAQYPEGVKRSATSVYTVTAAVLDVDDGWSPAEAADLLGCQGLEYCIYTTHSHHREHPKFRVAIPITKPCPAKVWPDRWARVAEMEKGHVDPGTFDPSRMLWWPSCPPGLEGASEFRTGHGYALDLDNLPPAKRPPAKADREAWDDVTTGPKLAAGKRNPFLVAYAKRLRWTGLGHDDIVTALAKANLSRCDPPKGDGEVRHIADWVMKKAPASSSDSARTDTEGISEPRGGSSPNPGGSSPGGPVGGRQPEAGTAAKRVEAPIPDGLFYNDGTEQAPEWKPSFPAFVRWFRETERFVVPIERGTFASPSNFELLRYDGGYYNGKARSYVRGRVEDAFRQQKPPMASRDAYREEVVKGIAATSELHRERRDFNPPDFLCLENAVLRTRTGATQPHSPDMVFTWKLPVVYDPAATCPRFVQFLEEVMPDEAKRELLVDLMGYCLWRANPYQLFFVLVGDGDNGKTTWGKVIEALLGEQAISTLSLQQVSSHRFAPAELDGKLVNLCDDLPYDRPLLATGILKVLTGDGTLTVERKNQHPFDLRFGGKLISMASRTPPTQDDTHAFWRRAFVIPFEEQFKEGDPRRDPFLKEKLLAELPGILNLALRGLARLRSRDRFDPRGLFAGSREQWQSRADPVREFLHTREQREDLWTPSEDLYRDYVRWCAEEGESPVPSNKFGERIKRVIPLSLNKQKRVGKAYARGYTWIGPRKTVVGSGADDSQKTIDGGDASGNAPGPDDGAPPQETGRPSSGSSGPVRRAIMGRGKSREIRNTPTVPDD